MNRTVILTNDKGDALGSMGILDAHKHPGYLHKAFSVFVFTPDHKNMIIQQRSDQKMLWPGIWANTCCSHPFEGEDAVTAGKRRLKEELGITCELTEGPSFVYRAEDPNGYGVEHERDVILTGVLLETAPVTPNMDEVKAWKWIAVDDLLADMTEKPDQYAPWLHQGLAILLGAKTV
jgi:isopentenyl-diphosphate Delta-isomerase